MKQLISLVLILGALFSCVKEKDYPVVFQYDYNSVSTSNITNYVAVLSDTALHITGNHQNGTIDIHIPKIGGNPLVVGEYSVSAKNGFYIAHTSTTGYITKSSKASLNLTHVNSYVNFTFTASLFNGITLKNGIAKNLPFLTEDHYYSLNSDTIPSIPFSNIDTVTSGIYAEMPGTTDPFYVPNANIIKTQTDSTITYRAIDGNFVVDIELTKPVIDLVGITFDLTQQNQNLVKMQWSDLFIPAPGNNLDFQKGIFQLFSLDLITGEIDFGFSGQLYNSTQTFAQPLPVGCGKKLTI